MHEVEFFEHLAQARGLPNFQVASSGFVAGAKNNRDGIDYLTPALNAITVLKPSFCRLEKILIVADNDNNAVAKLLTIKDKIAATADIGPGRRFAVPAQEQVSAGAQPSITILMLPWTGQVGALDTLCLAAASNKNTDVAGCVDAFERCIDVAANPASWPAQKIAKMKLRTHIAGAHPNDPYISPAWVWREGTDLVPLNDHVFDRIEVFLRNFLL